MHSFSDRLREQRDALGLSQQALADGCSIALRSQQNYEKGLRSPDADYLAALHEQGFDVLYILTGITGKGHAERALHERASALLPDSATGFDEIKAHSLRTRSAMRAALSPLNKKEEELLKNWRQCSIAEQASFLQLIKSAAAHAARGGE